MMAFSERSLDDYVDVAQRIADFREQYPTGSLQPADPASPWELATVTGIDKNGEQVAQTFVVYVAAAYRTPDDPRPGIGAAWEVFPGRTPYTRGSELQNAETSAWGRAIVAVLASDTKQGVASRQEVAARRAERDDGLPTNADGSLSRSRTTDAEKDAAGVMTSAQQAEHTKLQPKREPGRVTRVKAGDVVPAWGDRPISVDEANAINRQPDPWLDQPAGRLDVPQEDQPGTIDGRQQRKIMKRYEGMSREGRLAAISAILDGREIASTNELSWQDADRVIRSWTAAAK